MNRPLIFHSMHKPGTGSQLALAADISTLLPEYSHVAYAGEGVDAADMERDMCLLNAGMDVIYGRDAEFPGEAAVFTLVYGPGLHVIRGSHLEEVKMRNVPLNSNFRKSAEVRRTFRKFHVGLLFGRRSWHRNRDFMFDMLHFKELRGLDRLQFLVTPHQDAESRKLPEEGPIMCPFRSGMIHRYLEQCNVLAMPADGISDRLAHEARASGVPVITGRDADEIMTRIIELADDRPTYEEARRQALRDSAGNDLLYEIAILKAQLRRLLTWNISYSQCARAQQDSSMPEGASTSEGTPSWFHPGKSGFSPNW